MYGILTHSSGLGSSELLTKTATIKLETNINIPIVKIQDIKLFSIIPPPICGINIDILKTVLQQDSLRGYEVYIQEKRVLFPCLSVVSKAH